MNSASTAILRATVERAKHDDSVLATAFTLLRKRQLQRADVRQLLVELEQKRLARIGR